MGDRTEASLDQDAEGEVEQDPDPWAESSSCWSWFGSTTAVGEPVEVLPMVTLHLTD